MGEPKFTFKLILFGDGGVGKTSLAQRYLTGVFNEASNVTIGLEFYVKNMTIGDKIVKLQIWDFGGEERFRFLLPNYCKAANGAIFVYDVTVLATLHHLPEWLELIRKNAPGIPIIATGTKIDLVEKRKVTSEEAVEMIKSLKLSGYAEVSAKTGKNVDNVFETISKIMITRREKTLLSPSQAPITGD